MAILCEALLRLAPACSARLGCPAAGAVAHAAAADVGAGLKAADVNAGAVQLMWVLVPVLLLLALLLGGCCMCVAVVWSRYRTREEMVAWRARDPVVRLRNWLVRNGWWDEGREQELRQTTRQQVMRQAVTSGALMHHLVHQGVQASAGFFGSKGGSWSAVVCACCLSRP